MVNALASASTLVGRLAGEGRRLPNPHILIRPFVRREAVLSSRIEGTQATLGELLAAEAGATVERSPDDLRFSGSWNRSSDGAPRCEKNFKGRRGSASELLQSSFETISRR